MEAQTLGSLDAWIRGGLTWGLIPSSGVDLPGALMLLRVYQLEGL